MNKVTIIKRGIMKRIMLLIMTIWVLTFAVTPKPKTDKTQVTTDKEKIKIEFVKPEKVDKNDKNSDHFNDPDSNGVDDQRENDLKNIKELKSKHKDDGQVRDDKVKTKAVETKPPAVRVNPKKTVR